ncbi:hypothetical protein HNP33_001572 [Comamonas odontotermitis]|uniref:NERD domain-containing protein n=1 Tax=Comamonas odontotermitis TaxID=379895 RepID=A0ABR6REF5_9BURK|nr:nuclease-related domain-containing protein [Comamonas odontotermitis]MBB6577516.1 hypothetical protein [Comamonas odontotermitis]
MLIKSVDDQSKRTELLESLQQSPLLDEEQKRWLEKELRILRAGRSGERNAAHYLDRYYKDSPNLAVIHDLRLEMDGDVAQIDHLVISRGFMFYLLETKSFSGNLRINEHGEFEVSYGSKRYGIPSPLEQSKRHEKVLSKWLERLDITGRLGSKPQFFHVVLIDPKGTISRPDAAKFDAGHVIKADQFDTWRLQHVEKRISIGQTLTAMANLRSGNTVRDWAEKLARQHRPADPLKLPAFMTPKTSASAAPLSYGPVCMVCQTAVSSAVFNFCRENAKRFGENIYCIEHQGAFPKLKASVRPVPSEGRDARPELPRKRLICADCGVAISRSEGVFCWNNEIRFGGVQYCRTHQSNY